jgi:hypothetical protein
MLFAPCNSWLIQSLQAVLRQVQAGAAGLLHLVAPVETSVQPCTAVLFLQAVH